MATVYCVSDEFSGLINIVYYYIFDNVDLYFFNNNNNNMCSILDTILIVFNVMEYIEDAFSKAGKKISQK